MKKTIIQIKDLYYGHYILNYGPVMEKNIDNAHIFKSRHAAEYYFKHILKNYGYVKPNYITVKEN